MIINLRKANALQTSVFLRVKNSTIATSISLNEYQDPMVRLVAARNVALQTIADQTALLAAGYGIRELIGIANGASGISEQLTNAALLDKYIAQLRSLIESSREVVAADVIRGQLEKIRTTPPTYGLMSNTIESGVFTADDISSFNHQLVELAKRKQEVSEQLLELNIKTTITLPSGIVDQLVKYNLV